MDVIHHPTNQPASVQGAPHPAVNSRPHKKMSMFSMKFATVILLFGILVILVALIGTIATNNNTKESSFVNTNDYQAVFVNVTGSSGGQAYFGHIASINSSYIVLNDVFYLEAGTSSNQFTLNNLGCALYNPTDQMVINRDQVDFWENLRSNSQVTSDIGKWNTEKLTCPTNSSTTGTTPTTPTTPAK